MQQLNAQDAQFLYMETAHNLTHVTAISIYDPSTVPGGATVRFKDILAHVEDRLRYNPLFTRRLLRLPLEIDYPYWVDDEYFDLEAHVSHSRLPEPGDWRQFCIHMARYHSRPLDMNRPPWEMYVVEGLDHLPDLPKGSYAIATKVHHAAGDGASLTQFFSSLADADPHGTPIIPLEEPPKADGSAPGMLTLARRALGSNLRSPLRLASGLLRAAPGLLRSAEESVLRREQAADGERVSVPPTRFNVPVSPHKAFSARFFRLDTLREARKLVPGSTVNDVVLAICAGALRRYLDHHGELPEDSLVAWVPVNKRARDADSVSSGNNITAMTTRIFTNEKDPLRRLRRIHQATVRSKAARSGVSARLMTDLTQHMPAATQVLASRLVLHSGVASRLCNLFISNVPGPQVPLYMNGARAVHSCGLAPLADGMGLFIATPSYNGEIAFNVVSTREILPDIDFFMDCIDDAVAEFDGVAARAVGVGEVADTGAPEDAGAGEEENAVAQKGAGKETAQGGAGAPKLGVSPTLGIAFCGSGGAGVIACGELLLRAWARAGGLGFLRKAFGPQIRGGESAALLRLGEDERYLPAPRVDLLIALDWNQFARFEDEIALGPESRVLCPDDAEVPATVQDSGAALTQLPLGSAAVDAHAEGRINMFVLGLVGRFLGLQADALAALAEQRLAGKEPVYREAARACVLAGARWPLELPLTVPARPGGERWLLTGNQAAAYGAIEAGVRFAAAYPITPASDVLEYLAGALEGVGGHLVQAEDELAAVNMVLGAAFGGVDAFTATSGPGLALMTESLGLAVASETPLTVLDVMRGGPSTGIPTKSEQGDLDIALHGLHGDAPHLVLAALDIADCAFTTGWAVALARQLQTPALVLSDQFLGQSLAIVSPPVLYPAAPAAEPPLADGDYLRYRLTASGVSAMALPGDPGRRYTADGLEHNERGSPSTAARDHAAQLDKRARKLDALDPGDHWGFTEGEGALALVAFGSACAAVRAAGDHLREAGTACRVVGLRLLAPLPAATLQKALAGCRRVLVVEQNHSAQLWRHLRAALGDTPPLLSFAHPGPVPLDPAAIAAALLEEPTCE